MKIGQLDKELKGQLTLRSLGSKVQIRLTESDYYKEKKEGAKYDIYMSNEYGELFQIGRAWVNTVQNGENAGKVFLGLKIEDPEMISPVSLNAYIENDGTYSIHHRFRAKQVA